jgi:hypothetical protein
VDALPAGRAGAPLAPVARAIEQHAAAAGEVQREGHAQPRLDVDDAARALEQELVGRARLLRKQIGREPDVGALAEADATAERQQRDVGERERAAREARGGEEPQLAADLPAVDHHEALRDRAVADRLGTRVHAIDVVGVVLEANDLLADHRRVFAIRERGETGEQEGEELHAPISASPDRAIHETTLTRRAPHARRVSHYFGWISSGILFGISGTVFS